MSQPIGKHRKIDLIMEPCGSSICDIQGHGHAAHSPLRKRVASSTNRTAFLGEERMGRSAKMIEK